MTLKELTVDLEKVSTEIQRIRRSEFEIPGDVAFGAAMRQHIVQSLGVIRGSLDDLIDSLDRVDDVDKVLSMSQRIANRVDVLLGTSKDA